ncbi:MAG: NusG domain II-containing protein [Spirochaetaceae bacterium]|jgi:hypothetical protein|nr:NusG domain II-containing protein [Spirochaetaceae bacterium]
MAGKVSGISGGLRVFDFVLLILAVGATVLCAFRVYEKTASAVQLIIRNRSTEKDGSWIYPLDRAENVTIPGFLGDTIIEIGNGRARILASPCTNQTCVASGAIHSQGQWIACLPNGVFVSVESAGSGGGLRKNSGENGERTAGETGGIEVDGSVW